MVFAFDDYVLDAARRELRRAGARVDVEPQVFDLLVFLVRQRARVVTRDDLLEAVWQGRIVSESTLASRINAARAAIGDDGTAQRLIRTLPRKGVRFVAEVREAAMQAEPAPVPRPPPAPASEGPCIAVLPFDNMSGDSESNYFADGMAEEIITALARCSGMLVIARNSSFVFRGGAVDVRDVGQQLGAGYVLEGSVRRGGDRLRVTAQLIETAGGTHLWAETYDGTLSDVFELQDHIAASAAAVIEPKMRHAEVERARRYRPDSLEAYDLWLRAVWHAGIFTPDSMQAAQDCLARALAIEPRYALAMASSAYYHAQCHFQGWIAQPETTKRHALQLAADAATLAPNDANVLWQAGFAVWALARDGRRALDLFHRSLQINPNSAIALALTGWVTAANGDPATGRPLLERARRLSPRHPRNWFVYTGMAIVAMAEENFAECVTWCERALALNRRFGIALRVMAVALVNTGEIERARGIVAEAMALEPNLSNASVRDRLPRGDRPILQNYREALRKAGLPE